MAQDFRPDTYRALLERGRWFTSLPPTHRDALLAPAVLRRLPAGMVLFRRGDDNAGLYCVLEGAVRIGAAMTGDRDAVLSVLEPPQWFGEIACLDDGPRTHDAQALSSATLLLVPRPAIERLAAQDPLWWRFLGQLLAEKVRALFAGLEDLTQLSAASRVARRLLALSQGHGMLAEGLAHRTVPVNQEQLGAMLSLSRQTVSEVLRDFEARGWVKRHYRAVELLDWRALERAVTGGRADTSER
jgi:CRP/FNR family transcriptional regulator, cyclic AMP receptor protein